MNETFGPAMMFGPGPAARPGPRRFGGPGRGRDGPRDPVPGPARPAGRGRRARLRHRDLDPLVGLDDTRKPLRSRLLAVPALRARYLDHVRTIARGMARLGEARARWCAVPGADREGDRGRHAQARARSPRSERPWPTASPDQARGGPRADAAEPPGVRGSQRRYLLNHPEVRKAGPEPGHSVKVRFEERGRCSNMAEVGGCPTG